MNAMDTAARVRRGVATRRHEVRRRTRRRYQNTNNRYQSVNMTVGLSCQRDADMNVTDAASRGAGSGDAPPQGEA